MRSECLQFLPFAEIRSANKEKNVDILASSDGHGANQTGQIFYGLQATYKDSDEGVRGQAEMLAGFHPVWQLREILGINALPGEERAGFRTLGGFIMSRLASIPQEGQFFDWGRFRFEVVDMDARRVDKVLVSVATEELSPDETPEDEDLI